MIQFYLGKIIMKTFDNLLSEAGITRSNGYDFYFSSYIYKDINLDGKKILDIGGGNGLASFHALDNSSSCSAWVVDPIAEGSNELMFEQYESMKKNYDPGRINFHRDYVDTLLEPNTFDIIVMHNTINHIGEDILEDINNSSEAYAEYVSRLKTILDRLSSDGTLIVADCGSKNFFGKIPPIFYSKNEIEISNSLYKVLIDPYDKARVGNKIFSWAKSFHSSERMMKLQLECFRKILNH